MEIIIESYVFGLSNVKHLRRNTSPASGPAVLHWDDDVVSLPAHGLMMWQARHLKIWLNGPASPHK